MENGLLIAHLIIALFLIAVVLLQRSEGGALGMGGGGGGAGGGMVSSSRSAGTAIQKVTWGLAIAFLITSMTLTVLATRNSGESSVVDGIEAPVDGAPALPDLGGFTTAPIGSGPATPPSDAPATPPSQ